MNIPDRIYSGIFTEGHVQGIAVDEARGYVYFSFTTVLVKTDFKGNRIGTVQNLIGHLGCITFDAETNRVYGSLELKHDSIGSSIEKHTGKKLAAEDAFYLVSFNADAIVRDNLDAEKDGVMNAVWLSDVIRDYAGIDEVSGKKHRYGCSGIDGIALAPAFGADRKSNKKIFIAYGIYGDVERNDNDHQVILQYDRSVVNRYGKPLVQAAPHYNGPQSAEKRLFFRTGNTVYGIQNLEYDPASERVFLAVYKGKKTYFANFPMYVIDHTVAPKTATLIGRNEEKGEILTSAVTLTEDPGHPGLFGAWFSYGQTGMAALGDGRFCFSVPDTDQINRRYSSTVTLYRYDPADPMLFVRYDEH